MENIYVVLAKLQCTCPGEKTEDKIDKGFSHFQRKFSGFDRIFFGLQVKNFGQGCHD